MNKARRMSIAVAGAMCIAASAASAAGGPSRPHPVRVASAGHSVSAALGSYCVNGAHVGQCSDSFYPLHVKGRLPITIDQSRLGLHMHDGAVRSVRLQLIRAHGKHVDPLGKVFSGHHQGGHGNRWTARVPSVSGTANRLDIAVEYKHHIGDADYWAGVKVRNVR